MDPKILCHPNIPKPLHGIAPRVIYGKEWWDVERKKAYAKAEFHCEACGVSKHDAEFHRWLEAHEFYVFDYKRGTITFSHLVALCHSCHQFIHNGRMAMLVDSGEMSEKKYKAIIKHGMSVLKKAGLLSAWEARHDHPDVVPWSKWRLVLDGKEYDPSSANYTGWKRGDWRGWTPDRPTPKQAPTEHRMVWNNWEEDELDDDDSPRDDDWGGMQIDFGDQ